MKNSSVKRAEWALGAGLVVVVVLLTPHYLDLVTACGHFIPQQDLPTDYLRGVLWALLLGLLLLVWPVSAADKRLLVVVWLAKGALTLFLMLFYEQYYGSDANMYFGAARNLPGYIGYSFEGGTVTLIKLARFHNALVPESYHAMKVSCAMVGLIGCYLYYRAGVLFLGREDKRLFYLIAFFPGIFFWSSILGKDPLVFSAIALYSHGVVSWYRTRHPRHFLSIVGGTVAAACFREWLGPIMLVPTGIFLVKGVRGVWQRGALLLVVAVFLYFSANTMIQRFQLSAVQDVLSTLETASGNMSHESGGSTRQLGIDFSSPLSIALSLPLTSFTALFRPLPGEVMNPFGLLAGMESAALLYLLIRSIRRTRACELKDPLIMWAIFFVSLWAVVNGVVSSTNFGLAVRYKLQVLPVLLGVLLYLARDRAAEAQTPQLTQPAGAIPGASDDPEVPTAPEPPTAG